MYIGYILFSIYHKEQHVKGESCILTKNYSDKSVFLCQEKRTLKTT